MIKVYKPTSEYSKQLDTKIEKINFISAIINYAKLLVSHATNPKGFTTTVYTVPLGRIFYLNCIQLAMYDVGTTGLIATVEITRANLLEATLPISATGGAGNFGMSYPIPIRMIGGEILTCNTQSSHANSYTQIQFTGYEIDASLIPKFL